LTTWFVTVGSPKALSCRFEADLAKLAAGRAIQYQDARTTIGRLVVNV
jgi:hypothetical protein